jgi:hypothetical protein
MRTIAGPSAAAITSPGLLTAPGIGPGSGVMQRPETARSRPRSGREILRTAVPVVLVAGIFGFAVPHFASYRSVWASVGAMSWPQVLLVAGASATWIMICAVLPSLRLREAAVVNLGSNAVPPRRHRLPHLAARARPHPSSPHNTGPGGYRPAPAPDSGTATG